MMTFINTMIVQGQSIKDRVKVREDFMVERITDILAVSCPSPPSSSSSRKLICSLTQDLKAAYPDDEDLQEQCIVFDEELENDAAELKTQTASTRKRPDGGGDESNEECDPPPPSPSLHCPAHTDTATTSAPIEIIHTLWSKIKGTELENTFLSITRTLLHLGLSFEGPKDLELSRKVWGIIDKLLRQFDLMGNGSRPLSALTLLTLCACLSTER